MSITKRRLRKNAVYALGQVVLIFAGATVATWLENLNDYQKAQDFEKTLLLEPGQNLEVDLKWISAEVHSLNRGIKSSFDIINTLDERKLSTDSLKYKLLGVSLYSTVIFYAGA